MNAPTPAAAAKPVPAWRVRAQAAGIDPAEVEMVSGRYQAYRDFMTPRGGGLSLIEWFRFYRREKQSESPDQKGGVVSGCSATGEAVEQNVLTSPAEFFAVLQEQLGIQSDGR